MTKSAIKVLLRTRPTDVTTELPFSFPSDRKSVVVSVQSKSSTLPALVSASAQQYQFKFDNVLHNAAQEDVFEACAADALQNIWNGINSTIMCYGQTGAGKTYTMTGGRQSYSQRGLVPRVLSKLFHDVRCRQDRLATVQVSYLEIYNEMLFDLLELTTQPQEIIIHDDNHKVRLEGLRCHEVSSESDALQLLFEGETNRVIGEHQLNRESSRSHSIFTIILRSQPAPASDDSSAGGTCTVAKLHLVDLAGSERVCKTKSEGQLLREAGHINKSLSILEQVIIALGERGRDHVPYRSSKLTHVLRDSLGGNCATTMVANVWADPAQLDETLSTCRFAQRMTRITCEVSANIVQDTSSRARQLERELAELKQELAMHDAMAGRSNMQYSPYSSAQRAQLRTQVQQFLQASDSSEGSSSSASSSIEPLQLLSVRHMLEILAMCRTLYREHGAAAHTSIMQNNSMHSMNSPHHDHHHHHQQQQQQQQQQRQQQQVHHGPGVGDVDDDGVNQSGGVGVAPDDCRPGSVPDADISKPSTARGLSSAGSRNDSSARGPAGKAAASSRDASDRDAAWNEYKMAEGRALAEALTQNKLKLAQHKRTSKECAVSINGIKKRLDEQMQLAQQVHDARLQHQHDDVGDSSEDLEASMMGPEEMAALQMIQDLKAQYRDQFNELQMLKSEAAYTQQLVDQCSKELMLGFEDWFKSRNSEEHSEDLAPSNKAATPAALSARRRAAMGALAAAKPSSAQKQQEKDADYADMDPEAAAYMKAQQNLSQKLRGTGPPPGAIKANRPMPNIYFGTGKRSSINDKGI